MRRPAPRPAAAAINALAAAVAPATTLARVQGVWGSVTGPAIAAAAAPVAEHDGVLTVSCEAAVWAQELDLMGAELVARLNCALGAEEIRRLRCRAI